MNEKYSIGIEHSRKDNADAYMSYQYITGPKSLAKVMFNIETVNVENGLFLPYSMFSRVSFGTRIQTIFTTARPISENSTMFYWQMYHNFGKDPISKAVLRNEMLKTLEEDREIVENLNYEQKTLIYTKWDQLQEFYRSSKNKAKLSK